MTGKTLYIISNMIWISVATVLVSSGFASFALSRYLERGGGHFFFWGVGVFFYTLAVFSEILLEFFFGQIFVHLWYLSGAVLTAAWLGQGSLSFLLPTHWFTRITSRILVTASILAAVFITSVKVNIDAFNGEAIAVVYRSVLPIPVWLKIFTVSFNIYGTLLLLGVFIFISFRFFFTKKDSIEENLPQNKNTLPSLSFMLWLGFAVFTVGTMIPAGGSILVKKGMAEYLPFSEFLGAVFMLMGYLLFIKGHNQKNDLVSTDKK